MKKLREMLASAGEFLFWGIMFIGVMNFALYIGRLITGGSQ